MQPELGVVLDLRRPAVVALITALAWGCEAGKPGSAASPVVYGDSAGVPMVVNNVPAWPVNGGWQIDPIPLLHLGRSQGTEEEIFHEVVSVQKSAGLIMVALPTEIRFYNANGTFVRQLGAPGQGPGEFTRITSALACAGDDRIVAAEREPRQLTIFNAAGEPRTLLLRLPSTAGVLNQLSPLHLCTSSGVVGGITGLSQATGVPAMRRSPRLLVHVREADAQLDTLLFYSNEEVYGGIVLPFGRRTLIAARDTLLFMADTGDPEVRVYGLDGALRRVMRLNLSPLAVTASDVERRKAELLAPLPPPLAREVEQRLANAPIPGTMPYFSELRVALDGTIWLKTYQPFRDEEVTEWFVLDPDGRWLGSVELPTGFVMHEIGDEDLLGVWRDDLGIEFVRRYALQR